MKSVRAQAAILPGGRLHLHDGPIDLIIGADGGRDHVRAAYGAATRRFADVLDELCDELPLLREAMTPDATRPQSPVARRMDAATRPLCAHRFITRLAAVAGAVADEVLAAMCAAGSLTRGYVNNGGDIALHLARGARFAVGIVDCDGEAHPAVSGTATITHVDPIRGVATSGRGGRSFSLGIADSVTILARNAAEADAAATLVANAVDLPDHPAIARCPARDLDPQSDLGDCLVTRDVGALAADEIAAALGAGVREAQVLRESGAFVAAALSLRGVTRVVGPLPLSSAAVLAHAV